MTDQLSPEGLPEPATAGPATPTATDRVGVQLW